MRQHGWALDAAAASASRASIQRTAARCRERGPTTSILPAGAALEQTSRFHSSSVRPCHPSCTPRKRKVSRANCGSVARAPPRPRAQAYGAPALCCTGALPHPAPQPIRSAAVCSRRAEETLQRDRAVHWLLACPSTCFRPARRMVIRRHAEDTPATWSIRRGRAWCGYSESRSPGVASAASARRPRQAHPARATSAAPRRASTPCSTSAGSSARLLHRHALRLLLPSGTCEMSDSLARVRERLRLPGAKREPGSAHERLAYKRLPCGGAPTVRGKADRVTAAWARAAAQAAPRSRARRGARRAAPAGACGKAGSAGSGRPADASAKHDARLPPHTHPISPASAAHALLERPQPRRRGVPPGGCAARAKSAPRHARQASRRMRKGPTSGSAVGPPPRTCAAACPVTAPWLCSGPRMTESHAACRSVPPWRSSARLHAPLPHGRPPRSAARTSSSG